MQFAKRGQSDGSSSKANQGKVSEQAVQNWLKTYDSLRVDFDWKRNYDTHSAGSYLPAQTYDYEFYMPNLHGGFEVKETAHDYRLDHKNFSKEQVNKCRKRKMAGGHCYVLVFHTATQLWRPADIEVYFTREGGSWDLRSLPTFADLTSAIKSFGIF